MSGDNSGDDSSGVSSADARAPATANRAGAAVDRGIDIHTDATATIFAEIAVTRRFTGLF